MLGASEALNIITDTEWYKSGVLCAFDCVSLCFTVKCGIFNFWTPTMFKFTHWIIYSLQHTFDNISVSLAVAVFGIALVSISIYDASTSDSLTHQDCEFQ